MTDLPLVSTIMASGKYSPEVRAKLETERFTGEPDWEIQATTLGPILLVRNERFGSWCGYAGVTKDHPWHGQGYDELHAICHGGLTYSNYWQKTDEFCRVWMTYLEELGLQDHWWLGFDCAHGGDFWEMNKELNELLDAHRSAHCGEYADGADWKSFLIYRDRDYVIENCLSLLKQAHEALKDEPQATQE